jgi:multicomponent Na+:H+ antiporter subunit G
MRWFAVAWMIAGAAFMAIAAFGVARMPDLFTRMQAATKTGTAGAGCILLGTALFFGELEVATKTGVVIAFLFLTAPVAAHMLARAGYFTGTPLAPGTHPDELKDKFGRGHRVEGGTPGPEGEHPHSS